LKQAKLMPEDIALRGELKNITALIDKRRFIDAYDLCKQSIRDFPKSLQLNLAFCQVLKHLGRFTEMMSVVNPLLEDHENNIRVRFCYVETSIFTGNQVKAIEVLKGTEVLAIDDPVMLQHVAEFYTHCLRYHEATRCYRRALILSKDNSRYQYNLAASLISLGELDEAESLLDSVIESDPKDYDAYQNRSTIRKQTQESNHVSALKVAISKLTDDRGLMQLSYALAKELEDLEEYPRSFHYLAQGADVRRRRMKYKVDTDVSTMAEIKSVFDRGFFESLKNNPPKVDNDNDVPIFVCGLPRSGTTLVDRIISSHSSVTSLGEINDFAINLVRSVGRQEEKHKLVNISRELDHQVMGENYLTGVKGYGYNTSYFIDKTPVNYLYFGLIRAALPQAIIIHIRRHPLDSCYAMYKTLFRMGYPFTYNLSDLADYYIAYYDLMSHWRESLGENMFEICYEDLIEDPQNYSRVLLNHCGLEWQSACAEFHLNSSPAATASASQVRQPIYKTSVARWQCYEKELAPLIFRLKNAGIEL